MTEHESQTPHAHGRHGHDRVSTSPVGVVAIGIALLALVAFAMFLMFRMTLFFEERGVAEQALEPSDRVRPSVPEGTTPPPPHVQPNQRIQLQRQRAEKSDVLNSYGWIDAREGIARIPIERAMALVAERGITPWEPAGESQESVPPTGDQPPAGGDDANN